jgi:hypothetical protein
MSKLIITQLVLVAVAVVPGTATAYMGPGAGLGMLGSLVAVVAALAVAAVGLVLLPLRIIMKKRRKASGGP